MNFQVFKLVLEKAQEPEIKLPTSTESLKEFKRELQRHIYFFFIDSAKDIDPVDHKKLWEILKGGNTREHDLPL